MASLVGMFLTGQTNIYTHAHTALGGAKTGIPLTPRQCGRDLAGKGVPQEEEDLLSGRARQGMDPALCKGYGMKGFRGEVKITHYFLQLEGGAFPEKKGPRIC